MSAIDSRAPTSRMRLLVGEDEKKIAAFVRQGLAAAGFNVTVCHRDDDGGRNRVGFLTP